MTRISLAAACVSLAGLASLVSAQSGRNTPRPEPPATVEAHSEYSESAPSRNRRPGEFRSSAADTAARTPQSPSKVANQPLPDGSVIRVDTNLITVPVSVFDRNGLYIPNLTRSDFRIFEDGVEQEIAYFGTSDKPFTVVLLLDTSLSTNYKIEEIRMAATAFVDQLRSQDAVMVVEFDGNVNVLTNVTRDRSRIYRAIGKADFGYGTSLYDAVFYSLRKKLDRIEGRKAIVLFTDGVDTTSEKAGYDTTLKAAEESDAMVFPIYYNTYEWNSSPTGNGPILQNQAGTSEVEYERGRKYLSELAEYTGGRVFRPDATPGGLTAAFEGIAEELRRQYNIGYVPADPGSPGQRKEIKVRVNRPNLVLRARDSYIVGATRNRTIQ